MSVKNEHTVKKTRDITFSAIVERIHEIDNVFLKVADGTLIKIRINPIKKEGNTFFLIPRIKSKVLIKKEKSNGNYIITDVGKNYDEYNVVGIDEGSGHYIVIAKHEISDAIIDLNLD